MTAPPGNPTHSSALLDGRACIVMELVDGPALLDEREQLGAPLASP
ncbi:MAG: hypothetical protein O2800_02105 [Planctomycetota bacterium]|nr:hypothetical protein [Planctomycetota bacterium]